jgi:hypothetical protein
MKSTIIRPDGSSIVVQQSRARRDHILVSATEQWIAIPVALAGVFCQAIEAAATIIEEGAHPDELPACAINSRCTNNCNQGRACPTTTR